LSPAKAPEHVLKEAGVSLGPKASWVICYTIDLC
jgi:hypothetical protein